MHTGKLSNATFILFGTTCAILKDGLNSQRTEVGTERTDNADVIGYELNARKYKLLKDDTKKIIFRINPRALNEMQLALVSIPAGGALVELLVEAKAQTDDDVIYEPFVLAAPPTPPPAPIIIKAGYEPLPEGTRIEMCFDIDKQKATWYPASVTKSHQLQDSGKVFTELSWDDKSCADDPEVEGQALRSDVAAPAMATAYCARTRC